MQINSTDERNHNVAFCYSTPKFTYNLCVIIDVAVHRGYGRILHLLHLVDFSALTSLELFNLKCICFIPFNCGGGIYGMYVVKRDSKKVQTLAIYTGKRTEWSPIRSVIIRE